MVNWINNNMSKDLRFHLSDQVENPELRKLIYEISSCARYVNLAIKDSNRGLSKTYNQYGEQQAELDVLSDQIIQEKFKKSMLVREFASEENEDIITFSHLQGDFSVTVDPLDGSSLVDVNLAIGTIVGIHQSEQIIEPNSMVAAMYITYGPLTTLVYASKNEGVHEFVLNPAGEFILSREDIKLEEMGKIYSPGGLENDWFESHSRYIDELRKSGYKLRYSGGMVPDINQILIKGGGIFSYPALKTAHEGKLRLLFEAQPMAFIVQEAGGAASNGIDPILEIKPRSVDQRIPLYIGSKKEVELAKKFIN